MQNDSIQFPAGSDWVHRGELPPLTLVQATHALAMCLLSTRECTSLSTEEPITARLALSSGRSAVVRAELLALRGGIGLKMTVDQVHEEDLPEVTRIHERVVASYPVIARALRAAAVQEVA